MPDEYADANEDHDEGIEFTDEAREALNAEQAVLTDENEATPIPDADGDNVGQDLDANDGDPDPLLDPEQVDEEANGSEVLHPEIQELLDKGYKHSQLVVKTHADGSFKSVEIAKNA